jgi:hypothetical protein
MPILKGRWRDRIANAFAVEPKGEAQPTAEQQPAVDWVCKQIAKRRLTTPGLIALEMCRPLNYVGAQAMHMLQPAVWALASKAGNDHYIHLANFLERRGSMDYMMRRIEHFENEFDERERASRSPKSQQNP